jgi:hypothetical protein
MIIAQPECDMRQTHEKGAARSTFQHLAEDRSNTDVEWHAGIRDTVGSE